MLACALSLTSRDNCVNAALLYSGHAKMLEEEKEEVAPVFSSGVIAVYRMLEVGARCMDPSDLK